jgi:hypothetical protein
MAKANSEYNYADPVAAGLRAANARTPRLYPTAIREFGEILSGEVRRGEWVQVGELVLRADGTDVESHLDELIAARTDANGCHCVIPDEIVKVNDEVWTSGSLKLQGERYRVIREAFAPGKEGDKAAVKLLEEEAKIYGTTVDSTVPGVAPGTPPKKEGAAPRLPGNAAGTNPWSKDFRGTSEQKLAAQIAIISSKGGPALASSLSRSCGVDLAGRPLRK